MENWGPHLIESASFQRAWVEATVLILEKKELRNLIVRIENINLFDENINIKYENFCKQYGYLSPKQVSYTIFPNNLRKNRKANKLITVYNRIGGFYDRLKKKRWGTYFRRMTNYYTSNGVIDQLGSIIKEINKQKKVLTSAYTIIIQVPGSETTRIMNKPCLNYIAFQLSKNKNRRIGLLAVYRNHDFLIRSYGNYLGLCNLLRFVCEETNYQPGPITCISSHAYICGNKNNFKSFIGKLNDY